MSTFPDDLAGERLRDVLAGSHYDVIIVGARVAGCSLAALLGDAGDRVLIVDRAAFPSPTISTHFFRGAGLVSVLQRLGLLERVLALGAPRLDRQYNYAGGTAEATVGPPQDPGSVGYCMSVRREPLDHLLADRACCSRSVDLLQRTRADALLWDADRVCGARLTTPAGERSVRARVVVGADGRHSFVARAARAPEEDRQRGCRALYYSYLRDFPAANGECVDGAEFSLLDDEMGYVFPSDAGFTCLALSVNLAAFSSMRKDLTTRFIERLSRHKAIGRRLAAAGGLGKVLGSGPEPSYVRTPAGPGWALVGDAGMHQDPWTGVGMDNASRHATFLADALGGWLGGDSSETDAMSSYRERRNEHAMESYRRTTTVAPDLRQLAQP